MDFRPYLILLYMGVNSGFVKAQDSALVSTPSEFPSLKKDLKLDGSLLFL